MLLEVRNEVARRIVRELLGEGWRADDPIATLGGKLGALANGTVTDIESYRRLVGEIRGLRDALALLDQTLQDLNDGKPAR